MVKHFTAAQLATLRTLRARFLDGTAGARDYWRSTEELSLYDSTFGERIGWKWDAVLRELQHRGWQPRATRVLDWGCGSGIAGRRALAEWPQFTTLALHDRSALAQRFAREAVARDFPAVACEASPMADGRTLLLVSHVVNELAPAALESLLATAAAAHEVLWVEAGTHADSRRLSEIRERLMGAGFNAIAPCPHQARCGMLAPENARHWCHGFAAPAAEAFQSGRWAEFGRELGIDLRSLPYSFLCLAREGHAAAANARVIGEPRESKGYLRVLTCRAEGVDDLMLQKRDAPELHRVFRKGLDAPLCRLEIADGKITAGVPV